MEVLGRWAFLMREVPLYRDTDTFLYSALEAHGGLAGREVVIMGSLEPWCASL